MIALFILTLLLSGFFSGSETAYISSNRIKYALKPYLDEEEKGGIVADETRFLTTTLVGNNVVMVACSSLAVLVFSNWISESLLVVFTTLILLTFGEIIPKSLAQQIPNLMVRTTSVLMTLFYAVFYPLIFVAQHISSAMISLVDPEQKSVYKLYEKRDLPLLIANYVRVTPHERLLLSRALRISKRRLSEIMIPRTEIVAVNLEETSRSQINDLFQWSGLSRLPVYRNNLDHIEGFVYILDILTLAENSLSDVLRPAFFIPEHTLAVGALNRMRRLGKSSAIVVDEHGGTAGLVTIEDIVEQLFGSIHDEFDLTIERVRVVSPHVLIANGRAEVRELNEKHHLRLPLGEYVTIAGLITAHLGTIPRPGEEIQLRRCRLIITRADERRILEVKIIKQLGLH